eukprot:4295457-Pleurochrysis_carterae.AAC.2
MPTSSGGLGHAPLDAVHARRARARNCAPLGVRICARRIHTSWCPAVCAQCACARWRAPSHRAPSH